MNTTITEDIIIEPIEVDKKTQKLMDNVISEWNKKQ